ncbi:S-adenosyl-L-methionine-dependent methyltransferase [Lasiosphaeris hirsuta]|uniref:S-adenosyl-L-methionine-dependent methyltransferase n=1 Tax=Lasiosphaeris hirsuta TaxID=260670 RepID=A0AA40DP78_9PEZI|nr:S-adenosyl-L-methionine-dependent methyltransferase [Lasiosphaeris hirsuta]
MQSTEVLRSNGIRRSSNGGEVAGSSPGQHKLDSTVIEPNPLFDGWAPLEVDSDSGSAQDVDRASGLESESLAIPTGLEVDDGTGNNDNEHERAASGYATSTYPRVQPAYQAEYPFENGVDNGTIDSSRTLYAEDVDFIMENGRQYCGDYFMPIDQAEQTRQYVVHQVYLKLFDLELTTVPLEDPHYILDVGTGIGEWAIGMAEKYPECEVFGTDIAPIQPTQQVPFNIEFHIENAEDEWIRPVDTVDLVHIRDMAGAFSDWDFIYKQAFECIRPGGWIEVLDFDDFYSDQNFMSFFPPDSVAHVIIPGILEAHDKLGRSRGIGHMKRQRLIDAGYVDVNDATYDLGIGTRENSSYGKFWLFAVVTGIEAICLRPLTKYLGWESNYVRDLCGKLAQETRALAEDVSRLEGFVVKLRVLTGRKPDVPGQWNAMALNENGDINNYSGGDDSTIGSQSGRTLRSEETI